MLRVKALKAELLKLSCRLCPAQLSGWTCSKAIYIESTCDWAVVYLKYTCKICLLKLTLVDLLIAVTSHLATEMAKLSKLPK